MGNYNCMDRFFIKENQIIIEKKEPEPTELEPTEPEPTELKPTEPEPSDQIIDMMYNKKEGKIHNIDTLGNKLNVYITHNKYKIFTYKMYFEGIPDEYMEQACRIFKEKYGESVDIYISYSKINAVFFDKNGENINEYIKNIVLSQPDNNMYNSSKNILDEWIMMEE